MAHGIEAHGIGTDAIGVHGIEVHGIEVQDSGDPGRDGIAGTTGNLSCVGQSRYSREGDSVHELIDVSGLRGRDHESSHSLFKSKEMRDSAHRAVT